MQFKSLLLGLGFMALSAFNFVITVEHLHERRPMNDAILVAPVMGIFSLALGCGLIYAAFDE